MFNEGQIGFTLFQTKHKGNQVKLDLGGANGRAKKADR